MLRKYGQQGMRRQYQPGHAILLAFGVIVTITVALQLSVSLAFSTTIVNVFEIALQTAILVTATVFFVLAFASNTYPWKIAFGYFATVESTQMLVSWSGWAPLPQIESFYGSAFT